MRDDTAAPVKIPEPAGPRCCHNLATMDGVALLKQREARCELYRRRQGGAVNPVEWYRAASLFRHLRATSPAVSAFLPIAALCSCPSDTAVVVHLCVQWGGCGLGIVDGALREELCKKVKCSRNEFVNSYNAIVFRLDGGDVRAWGPSTFEYVYEMRDQLTRPGLIRAVRCCLIRSKTWTDQPASVVADEIMSNQASTGYSGSLVTLLLQRPGGDAEHGPKRARRPAEYEVERVERTKLRDNLP